MPAGGLGEKKMADEHHNKVNHGQDQEHFVNAALSQRVKQSLHNRAGDCLGGAEACHCKSGGKTFTVLKPEHEGFHRREITGSKTDSHDEAVAHLNAQKGYDASGVGTAVPDEEAGSCHP